MQHQTLLQRASRHALIVLLMLLVGGCNTVTPDPTPTPTPITRSIVKIVVHNQTGGILELYLWGPTTYAHTFTPGNHVIHVMSGTYTYEARFYGHEVFGCGDKAVGERSLSQMQDWYWTCGTLPDFDEPWVPPRILEPPPTRLPGFPTPHPFSPIMPPRPRIP